MTSDDYIKIIYEKAWSMRTKEEDEAYSMELRVAYALARREYVACVIRKRIGSAEENMTRREFRERWRSHAR